ncbi:hypothetical protein LMG28727_06209 [Paraburkholderia kirstenboschensis]|uniref:hypothetical protein n=1 Tax=Paraburkholderia kirstenboschensis TaxID=1245436 RepID=UPI000AE3128B|nr:hypothetical protein [Paraburkholderia kirstenboschensis]CAD6556842.1 hypothetical protein LMG28727_06209 [Paraburkholderia kirstenboschensis]
MSEAFKKKVEELRMTLMEDLSPGDLMNLQLKVDTLMRLAMMDAGHDHDTQGGVGHHDHTALADLSWRLETPRQMLEIDKKN